MLDTIRSFEAVADDIAEAMFWADLGDDFDAPPIGYEAGIDTYI
jgi:hypothetical protein